MNPNNADFIINLDELEKWLMTYKETRSRMEQIILQIGEMNRNIPLTAWQGDARYKFQNRMRAWILRMEKLELEILYTIMIMNHCGGKSDFLRQDGEGYADILTL